MRVSRSALVEAVGSAPRRGNGVERSKGNKMQLVGGDFDPKMPSRNTTWKYQGVERIKACSPLLEMG